MRTLYFGALAGFTVATAVFGGIFYNLDSRPPATMNVLALVILTGGPLLGTVAGWRVARSLYAVRPLLYWPLIGTAAGGVLWLKGMPFVIVYLAGASAGLVAGTIFEAIAARKHRR